MLKQYSASRVIILHWNNVWGFGVEATTVLEPSGQLWHIIKQGSVVGQPKSIGSIDRSSVQHRNDYWPPFSEKLAVIDFVGWTNCQQVLQKLEANAETRRLCQTIFLCEHRPTGTAYEDIEGKGAYIFRTNALSKRIQMVHSSHNWTDDVQSFDIPSYQFLDIFYKQCYNKIKTCYMNYWNFVLLYASHIGLSSWSNYKVIEQRSNEKLHCPIHPHRALCRL